MLASAGVRRPRTRGLLAPLALNGNPGVTGRNYALDTREWRLQSAHDVSQISAGGRATVRRLMSVETTGTTQSGSVRSGTNYLELAYKNYRASSDSRCTE
jgi:hypothetical protein